MDEDEIEEEEFGFSRNYFLAKELGSSKKKSVRKLSEINLVDEEKALIEDFSTRSLTEYSVVVVNGYLQSINLKQVVITLAELLWDQLKLRRKTTSGSLSKSQQPFNTRSMADLIAFLDRPDLEVEEGKKLKAAVQRKLKLLCKSRKLLEAVTVV
ncbi:hypothetical protein RND71_038327 [Anisodus tanguticus]|uniref:Origin recognition complex subunit 2 n=1 Tax=Anisodus tanguticus TaxID=243964 RepID=A0AAE1R079_9SOLA|nr:hypothetical protein RND71_038327 [Anisodus tanguticus]